MLFLSLDIYIWKQDNTQEDNCLQCMQGLKRNMNLKLCSNLRTILWPSFEWI